MGYARRADHSPQKLKAGLRNGQYTLAALHGRFLR
jgi:hypothetical protein